MRNTLVRHVMSDNVYTITRQVGVNVALETMLAHGVKRLPVISTETGRVMGIVSRSDARTALLNARADLQRTPTVDDAMSNYVYKVGPDDTVAHAIEIMVNHQVGGLPVVDGKDLVGIITTSDILKLALQTGSESNRVA